MNKNKKVIAIIGVIVISGFAYYFIGSGAEDRRFCESMVSYHPKTESVQGPAGSNSFASKQGEEEHYKYFGSKDKFKTKQEAIKKCMKRYN
jgi:hypothetical protein